MNRKIILIAFFLTGMAALIYEVVWTRPLSLVLGSSVYAVSTMLTSFMAGLAFGSWIFSKYADRFKSPLFVFAVLELCIGIYGLVIIAIFNSLSGPYLFLWNRFHMNFTAFSFVQFLFCFLVLLIPTTLMGATWPVVNKAYIKHFDKLGKGTGILYSVNSFGAIIGSWLAGFILIPAIGIRASVIFAAFLNLIAASVVFYYSRKKHEEE